MNEEALYREFEIREINDEERTVSGVAIPYNEVINVGSYREMIAPGAFGKPEDVQLFYGHNHRIGEKPIGKVVEFRETDEGLVIKARISDTSAGREVHTLLKDGVIKKFSAGFNPLEQETNEDGVVVRTKANLFEVSVVPMPAYKNAAITEVREDAATNQTKEGESDDSLRTDMTDNNIIAPEVAELREAVADLERKFDVATSKGNDVEGSVFRDNGGEFLKALVEGDERAQAEFRAFTGATTTDSIAKAAWVDRGLKLVEVNRKAYNLFNHKALPASGNTIEYPMVSSVSGSVAAQAAEGDDLTYSEVVLTTATADVKTYGGYTSLSKQAIQRSSVNYLETALDHLARNYGRATNAAVSAAAVGASGVNTGTGITLATGTGANWLTFALEGAQAIEDNGLGAQAEFMWVSRDVFNKLITLADSTGRPLVDLNRDGSNTLGNMTVATGVGTFAGLPLIVDAGLGTKKAFIGAAEAIEVYESAGAPYRLGDENVINLTEDFSLYGYMAIAIPNPKALFKVTVA